MVWEGFEASSSEVGADEVRLELRWLASAVHTLSHWCEQFMMGRTSKIAAHQFTKLLKQNAALSVVVTGVSFTALSDSTSPVPEITRSGSVRQIVELMLSMVAIETSVKAPSGSSSPVAEITRSRSSRQIEKRTLSMAGLGFL